MASMVIGGNVRLIPEIKEKVNVENMTDEEREWAEMMDEYEGYPFIMPKVFLEGIGEEYYPQMNFSWMKDSLIYIRNNVITKYAKSYFTELQAEDAEGNIIWVDGRNAPYSGCWDGKYLGEAREAEEITIDEYDPITLQARTYKVTLERSTKFDENDYKYMQEYFDIVKKDYQDHLDYEARLKELCNQERDPNELPF